MEDRDVTRLIIYGSYIAWAEAVKPGSEVLEISTGLGGLLLRPLDDLPFALPGDRLFTRDTRDSPLQESIFAILRIFLSSIVKMCLCDATIAVHHINDSFDHIIHNGGPNPNKNPALFSSAFLSKLVSLLKVGGALRPREQE